MKHVLTIELIPETSWYNNLRSLLPKEAWQTLRKKVLRDHHFTCAICGGHTNLECHEVWEFHDETHVQKLTSLVILCDLCHGAIHIGRTGNDSREFYENVVAHFMKLNECTRMEFELAKIKAFEIWEERSKNEWQLDIGDYQKVNFI